MNQVRASGPPRIRIRGGEPRLAWLDPQRLLLLVFVGSIFCAAAAPLLDPDLWWHLADGRWILAHGRVPATDQFSFTAAGHAWVVQEWLADVGLYTLYRGIGLTGLVLLAAAVVAAAALAIQRLLRAGGLPPHGSGSVGTPGLPPHGSGSVGTPGLGESSAVILAGVLALASSSSWGARPQILNLLFAALLCLLLLRYRRRPGPWVYWLLPGFVLWANLHSGYLFGAGLAGVFAAAETLDAGVLAPSRREGPGPPGGLRRLWTVAVLGAAAGLLTPAGYRTVLFPFGTLGSTTIQSNIQEWLSPDFHRLPGVLTALALGLLLAGGLGALPPEAGRRRPAWWLAGAALAALLLVASPDFHQTLPRLLLLAAALAATVWALVRRVPGTSPPVPRAETLWAIATAVLALTSVRHVALFAAAAAPALGRSVSTLLAGLSVAPRRALRSAAVGALNLVLLAALAAGAAVFVAGRVSPAALEARLQEVEPVGAVDRLLARPLPQPLFNFYDWGGYVLWRAGPGAVAPDRVYRVFIDGRVEVYGDALFARYLDTDYGTARWRDALRDYRIQTVLLPTSHPLGRLLLDDGWVVAYRDRTATLYVRG